MTTKGTSSTTTLVPNVATIIDNTQRVYIPIRLPCGITVMYSQDIFEKESLQQESMLQQPQIHNILQTDVLYCLHILPISVHALIKRTKIWINRNHYYSYDPQMNQSTYMNHMTTHHHVAWLLCAHDRIDKVFGIEIYNIYDYIRMRHHWNGSGLLLHEYCHIIHQHVFTLNCLRIQKLYHHTKQQQQQPQDSQIQKYHTVLRRDWAGGNSTNGIETDLAYCMMDCKEFFAELSVTYLAKHSMFQYLDTACCTNMVECSPPITEPTLIQRIQESSMNDNHKIPMSLSTTTTIINRPTDRPMINKLIETMKNYLLFRCNDDDVIFTPHCNKFYPFTSGQFQHYDPLLYTEFQNLWYDVAMWEDPYIDNTTTTVCTTTCQWIHHTWFRRQQSKKHNNSYIDVDTIESPLMDSVINDTVDL